MGVDMRHAESKLQQECVTWFRLQFPRFAKLLFAVPNGGARNRIEAAILKGEGVTAGVADLILLLSRKGYTSLCIEMKTDKKGSAQSPSQKQWQAAVENYGNKYVVCRSFDQFKREIENYLVL